ncbi:MAG: phytoene desaturase family protein [Polyangiales bacterium]
MPDVGVSYKQQPPQGAFDAIVIGSGIGGLATAAALSKIAGKRVLVLERHYVAGGFTHAFHRPGYEWDVGVHYIGQVGSARGQLKPFFDFVTDGKLEWAPLPDVYDRIFLGDRRFDLPSGKARFAAAMKAYFPKEERAIDRYLDLVRASGRTGLPYFAERALPASIGRVVGPLLRAPHQRYASRTVADVLGELTSNTELIAVLTGQYGDYGLPPSRASFSIHAAVVGHYLGGAWYPVGGAPAIARAIEPVIAASKGQIMVSAEVERVLVESGRAVGVRMIDGRELRAPIVVSDAGVRLTFDRLLPEAPAPAALRTALTRIAPSSAHACLYLGLQHTDAELGLTGTNLWLYPDGDHDGNVARFERDPEAPLPLVYVSFPSAKDPTFAARHPGRSTIDVITIAPWSTFSKWGDSRWKKRGTEYEAAKARLAERLLDVLYKYVPQVRGKIDVQELSTPLTTRHFATHPHGEIYGLDHTPDRFRVPLRAETHVRGLFLTGSDLATAGVAGALFGGVISASAILRRNVAFAAIQESRQRIGTA